MKKILILLAFAFIGFTSCQKTDFKSTAVENPKKETTVNMLSTMDTAVIKIDTEAHKLYIVENNLVVREFKWYNNDEVPIPPDILILLMFLGACIGALIMYWIIGN